MLIKPNLTNEEIMRCLQDAYGLNVETISFLPLGADFNTAVYQVTTDNKTDYFLKLRRGNFIHASVSVPKYLADFGLKEVITPITNKTWQFWVNLAYINFVQI